MSCRFCFCRSRRVGLFQKGNTLGRLRKNTKAWNKGVRGYHTSLKGRPMTQEWKDSLSVSRLGKPNPSARGPKTESHRKALSESHKGKQTWNKGVSGYHNSPYPESHRSKEVREVLSNATRDYWKRLPDEEKRRRIVSLIHLVCLEPNKVETRLGKLIEFACPGEYAYTGNGSILVCGYAPDFSNVNGQKKVIEMFGDYWHKPNSDSSRIEMFKSFGYDCLVIWESEMSSLTSEQLTSRIREFNGKVEVH